MGGGLLRWSLLAATGVHVIWVRFVMDHFHKGGLCGVQATWVGEGFGAHDGRRVDFFGTIEVLEGSTLWLNFVVSLKVHVDLMSDLAVAFHVTV